MASYNIKNSENIFIQSYSETIGEIIGYRQIDEGKDKPQISFTDDGKNVKSEAKAINVNSQTHPAGTQVRIAYIPVKIMGINGYDARIINDNGDIPKLNGSIIIMYIMSGVLLAVTLIFTITAILKYNI